MTAHPHQSAAIGATHQARWRTPCVAWEWRAGSPGSLHGGRMATTLCDAWRPSWRE